MEVVKMRQKRFTDWKEAHAAAVEYANLVKMDVALRAVKQFGQSGFNISIASRNDSDYACAEIVHPSDPS